MTPAIHPVRLKLAARVPTRPNANHLGEWRLYACTLTGSALSDTERELFEPCLSSQGVDQRIWQVLDCFMGCKSHRTQPMVLRAYFDRHLAGAAHIAQCTAWGGSVFRQRLIRGGIDVLRIPAWLWVRVGYGHEVLANPGVAAPGFPYDEVIAAMIDFLHRRSFGAIIIDRTHHQHLHTRAMRYAYASDGTVPLNRYQTAADFVSQHPSVKRKVKAFQNRGGRIHRVYGAVAPRWIAAFRRCMTETVSRSAIFTPWQDNFEDMAAHTCERDSPDFVHLIATMNDSVLGYHSFIRSGHSLHMMHGAFDRSLKTTHHCYENLIIASVQLGLDEGLRELRFGPVMNETKRRMMSVFEDVVFNFYAGSLPIRLLFPRIFPYSRMQADALLQFADLGEKETDR